MWHSNYPAPNPQQQRTIRQPPYHPPYLLLFLGRVATAEMAQASQAMPNLPAPYSPSRYLVSSTGISHDELRSQYESEYWWDLPDSVSIAYLPFSIP